MYRIINHKYDIRPISKCEDRFHLIFSPNSPQNRLVTEGFKGDHSKDSSVSGYHSTAPNGKR